MKNSLNFLKKNGKKIAVVLLAMFTIALLVFTLFCALTLSRQNETVETQITENTGENITIATEDAQTSEETQQAEPSNNTEPTDEAIATESIEQTEPTETKSELETEPQEVVFEETVDNDNGDGSDYVDYEPIYEQQLSSNRFENYVGRFKIPSVNVSVACYAGSSQEITDAEDSAAYFYGYGHMIIADHKNQGFNSIKYCEHGTSALMETPGATQKYYCVAKINGHNDGHVLTDENWNSIEDLYPNTLACYTCNENWQNVTIVFFAPENSSYEEDLPEEDAYVKDDEYGCGAGNHIWKEWEEVWELMDGDGQYHCWNMRSCAVCRTEEWVECEDAVLEESEEEEADYTEETIPEQTEPITPSELELNEDLEQTETTYPSESEIFEQTEHIEQEEPETEVLEPNDTQGFEDQISETINNEIVEENIEQVQEMLDIEQEIELDVEQN